ncbi:A disintegrin and metalloproteinase with thrombospondin motifs 2 isoform X2 [Agrilus planipennis]|uniref:A disintegrin and metalloproteinase with thrombospondin motifs 2 isoform X2 n=1 Tax=Agrilus planipennis TaxID=224129 RepID=A0A1W4WDK2_AGRPL|nr:A disintegrin and metalloproteinase with thrombospondin motifs 2 isoform X2 [Agrilus planipennis]
MHKSLSALLRFRSIIFYVVFVLCNVEKTLSEDVTLGDGDFIPFASPEDDLEYISKRYYGSNIKDKRGEDVEIVVPKIFHHKRRMKRDLNPLTSYEEVVHEVTVNLGKMKLELRHNDDLIIPRKGTWIYGNFTKEKPLEKCYPTKGDSTKYSQNISAFITLCGSKIMGLIHSGNESFSVEPFEGSDQLHILRRITVPKRLNRTKRESATPSSSWEFFNLTGDTFDITGGLESFGLEELHKRTKDLDDDAEMYRNQGRTQKIFTIAVEDNSLWTMQDGHDDDIGYFVDSAWDIKLNKHRSRPSSGSPQRWLEIAVAIDNTVISFHGKDRVEHYVLSLMNIVSAIYQDPSLEANMQLIITRLFFYEHKKENVLRPGNSKRSLENVNAWNRRLHLSLAPGEPQHDVAVWLTRVDIGGPSGYAPIGGACDPKRSCALNKDEGLSSAFIIAHEMGHLLGLTHDGDKKWNNNCGDEAIDGSVMAPMVAATFHKFSWSQCSKDEFKSKLNKWFCLRNSPPNQGEIPLNGTVYTTFSMDEQCRTEFGDGYELCRAFDVSEPCSHLWCSHEKTPLVCKTKKGPPLEGTECGFNKWCIDGYCQDVDVSKFGMDPVIHNPQDGGWSDWSEWGACSRSCGTGVQFRTRKCDNPLPSYGGSECFGLSEEWRVCNLEKCPGPMTDIRAQQCNRLPQILKLRDQRANVTWLPYESDDERLKCQLICLGKETRELFVTGENLLDGTPCSYDNGSDICIQGLCQPVGCDGKLFSGVKEDACGICGGDNSDCKEIRKFHQKKIKRELSRLAVIPKMSREIKIQANLTAHASLNLSVAFILKDRLRRKYLLPIPNTNLFNEIIEGTRFMYTRRGPVHNLQARGPILAEIVVLLHIPKTDIEIGVNVSYSSSFFLNKTLLKDDGRYGWLQGGWGACTASCGGGKRQRTVACWDRLHERIVPKRHCSLAFRPATPTEKCNTFSCNFQWLSGRWEPCSATCGSNGVQYREVYCVHRSIWYAALELKNETIRDSPWRYMVSPNKCAGQNPQTTRPCHRIPCPSYWEFGEWSQCSVSCGTGLSTRQARCTPFTEDETFYTCGPTPPIQNRVCTGATTKSEEKLCRKKKKCTGDLSKYCSIKILQHYCQVGGFRKLCCETCKQHRKLAPVSS